MEVLLVIVSVLCIAGGIVFSILPPLPGPLLTYLALVTTHYVSPETNFSIWSFVIWGIVGGIILVLDYVLPAAATRRFGGTKAGMIGGMIGTVVGAIFFPPFGIILGPLLGAIIGDLIGGNRIKSAFRSGFGSFVGFLVATSMKLLYSIILGVVIVIKVGGFTAALISDMF